MLASTQQSDRDPNAASRDQRRRVEDMVARTAAFTGAYGRADAAAAVRQKRPRVVVCGHIHESAGEESHIGDTRVLNAGPDGTVIDL